MFALNLNKAPNTNEAPLYSFHAMQTSLLRISAEQHPIRNKIQATFHCEDGPTGSNKRQIDQERQKRGLKKQIDRHHPRDGQSDEQHQNQRFQSSIGSANSKTRAIFSEKCTVVDYPKDRVLSREPSVHGQISRFLAL